MKPRPSPPWPRAEDLGGVDALADHADLAEALQASGMPLALAKVLRPPDPGTHIPTEAARMMAAIQASIHAGPATDPTVTHRLWGVLLPAGRTRRKP